MNAQQLKNSILQDLYSAKDGWTIRELKDIVADSCPISYGIVQQGNIERRCLITALVLLRIVKIVFYHFVTTWKT